MLTENPMYQIIRSFCENASPAGSLALIVGTEVDDEGWEWDVRNIYCVNAIVVYRGQLWKIWGFTLDDKLILRPYGLGHDPAIHSTTVSHMALTPIPLEERYTHKDALI